MLSFLPVPSPFQWTAIGRRRERNHQLLGGFPGPVRPTWVLKDTHVSFQQTSLCCLHYLKVSFQQKQIQDRTPNGTESKLQIHGKNDGLKWRQASRDDVWPGARSLPSEPTVPLISGLLNDSLDQIKTFSIIVR